MDLGLRFYQMMHRFRRLQIPERLGMRTRSEHMVLELLLSQQNERGEAAFSCAELARRMDVTAPAVSRTLRHLREQELISAEPDPRDRRGAVIRLTEDGRAALYADREKLDQLMERAATRLRPGEFDQFFDTFERLCASLQTELDLQTNPERNLSCEASSDI